VGKVDRDNPAVAELQAACDLTCEALGIGRPPRLLVTTSQRGRASYRTHTVRIPAWAIDEGELFAIAYVVHEVAHFASAMRRGHGQAFQAAEERGLAVWGITLTRKRGGVYCEALTDLLGMSWSEKSAKPQDRPASAIGYCPCCEKNRRHYYREGQWNCGKCGA